MQHPTLPASDGDDIVKVAEEEEEEVAVYDDWGLSMDFHLFARHEAHPVYIPEDHDASSSPWRHFQILCVEALTPLDMVHLGSGIHDATGHCVWTGAFLLIALLRKLDPYFVGKRIIELGCGTGIGGIALLIDREGTTEMEDNNKYNHRASFVAFTDGDPEALDLCKRNCQLNNIPDKLHIVEPVLWGDPLPNVISNQQFDTVLATDVLYDIGLLPLLLQTARQFLNNDHASHFVLAHVPRACYNSQNPPVHDLETYIIRTANDSGFELEQIIRPLAFSQNEKKIPENALNNLSLLEMDEIGAAVMVFRYQRFTGSICK